MDRSIDFLESQTLSGTSFGAHGEIFRADTDDFIRHLGDSYAPQFIETIYNAANLQDGTNCKELFYKTLEIVRNAESVSELLNGEATDGLHLAVWGLARIDELVTVLTREPLSIKALFLLDRIADAFTEVNGRWVLGVAHQVAGSRGGKRKYEKHSKAREFVRKEWSNHAGNYLGNKSAFARDYSRRVANELDVLVTEKTIREVWLKQEDDGNDDVGDSDFDTPTTT